MTFIDDCSDYTFVYLMKNKSDALDMFKVFVAEIENQFSRKIKRLRSDTDADMWQEAINDKMESIESNRTWHLVDLPLVAKGFKQRENVDFFDTYSPVTRITSIRVLIALAYIHDLVVHKMDVKTAFLNGELNEEIYMDQPEGFIVHGQEHKVLWYATDCTRPDIAYVVGLLCRFTSKPDESKATSGYIFSIAGGAITWKSKKQTILSQSSMEFEIIALATASEESSWLRCLLAEILLWEKPIPAKGTCNLTHTREIGK
nr:retrotransposon-related protein [Tanacetum cinerariifolium]